MTDGATGIDITGDAAGTVLNLRIESIKADSGRACRLKPGLATEYLGMLPKINTSLKKECNFWQAANPDSHQSSPI
jgi:hypothetical protein